MFAFNIFENIDCDKLYQLLNTHYVRSLKIIKHPSGKGMRGGGKGLQGIPSTPVDTRCSLYNPFAHLFPSPSLVTPIEQNKL